MNVISNEKMEIVCDDYKREFTLSINDLHGHYLDETKLSREDIIDLYHALEKLEL